MIPRFVLHPTTSIDVQIAQKSKLLVQVFDAKGISYREYILDHHFSREAFYGEFGDLTTFPQVLLNADKLGGCVETVKYLRENNII